MKYKIGELAKGQVVGTKRKVAGMESIGFYECWNGERWIDEDTFNYDLKECPGCANPFCDCEGAAISDDPFRDTSVDDDTGEIKRIKELMQLKREIDDEIMHLLNKLGGAGK